MKLTEEWVQEQLDREFEDLELVLLEVLGNRRNRVLRLFVDHPSGVTHELLAEVSRSLGETLDESRFSDEPYTLEVSSPGIERPLVKKRHFEQQVGKKIYVKTFAPVEGQKVWRGVLREVGENSITVDEDKRGATIELENVAKAHLVFEFE